MSVPYLPGLLDQPPAPSMMRMAPPAAAGPTVAPITQRIRPYRGSLFDRFKQALMPTPAGMQGLLNPEQESAGRNQGLLDMGASLLDSAAPVVGAPAPSLGQAIAHGIQAGRAGYAQHAQEDVSGGLLQDEQSRKQQMLAQREAIQRKYQLPPNATAEQTEDALKGMFADFVRNGDTEMVGKLAQVIPSLQRTNQPHPVEHLDLGDMVSVIDAVTGKEIARYKKGITPKTASEISTDDKFKADQKNKILDDYARDTKDFHQVMAGWDVLQGATKDPTLATPFAITDAYARITNPGAIVRPTTLDMIHDMGSVGQKMQKWWAANANGALPPEIVQDFKTTLYNIVRRHYTQYNQIRSKAIERAKQSGIKDIDSLLEQYSVENPMTPATRPPGTGNPMLKR